MQFGKDGWLTAEFAVRDYDKDGIPDTEATLRNVELKKATMLLN